MMRKRDCGAAALACRRATKPPSGNPFAAGENAAFRRRNFLKMQLHEIFQGMAKLGDIPGRKPPRKKGLIFGKKGETFF